MEKGTNCCLVFSFFALCANYFFHRLTRPVKHINPRNPPEINIRHFTIVVITATILRAQKRYKWRDW